MDMTALMTGALLLLGALSVASSTVLDLQGASSHDHLQSKKEEVQPMVNQCDTEPVQDPSQCIGLRDWCRSSGHYDWIFCTQAYIQYMYGGAKEV